MPKTPTSRAAAAARRHNPLAEDIVSAGHLRTQSSKKGKRRENDEEDGENDERYIDAKMSRKILQIGQDLADEDAAEQKAMGSTEPKANTAFDFDSRFDDEEPMSDDEDKFGDEEWIDEEVEEVVRVP
jgi:essential nuclear protein 1